MVVFLPSPFAEFKNFRKLTASTEKEANGHHFHVVSKICYMVETEIPEWLEGQMYGKSIYINLGRSASRLFNLRMCTQAPAPAVACPCISGGWEDVQGKGPLGTCPVYSCELASASIDGHHCRSDPKYIFSLIQ